VIESAGKFRPDACAGSDRPPASELARERFRVDWRVPGCVRAEKTTQLFDTLSPGRLARQD
jgi:hypothetical protein